MSTSNVMVDSYLTPKLKEGETVDLSLYSPRERTNIRLYGLACKDWTPADVFDYKRNWKPNAEVVNIKGGHDKASAWCKTHLYMQDWDIIKHAMPDDSHNVLFKNPEEAMLFRLSNG